MLLEDQSLFSCQGELKTGGGGGPLKRQRGAWVLTGALLSTVMTCTSPFSMRLCDSPGQDMAANTHLQVQEGINILLPIHLHSPAGLAGSNTHILAHS